MSETNQFSLLRQRRFAPFFATQFLGAFNDNIFRNGLVILITAQGVLIMGMDHKILANLAGALFIFPFFIFSAIAGQLADKYEKSKLFRRIKLLEIGLMILASAAFLTGQYSALFAVLFLMGFQSALFGPVKYAYLPQQLMNHELVGGNGLVESGTYVAIILGLIVGNMAVSENSATQTLVPILLVTVAFLGYLFSRQIPSTKPVDPDLKLNWNVWSETWRIVGYARREKSVFLSILGISWFWFFGSVMTLQVPAYTIDILNGGKGTVTLLLIAFSVGVGVGSLLCERMSGGRVELGLVPFGSIGLSLFAVDLYFAQPVANAGNVHTVIDFVQRDGSLRILFDLTMLGAFGGFYSVPLYAMVQERANRQQMSRIIAANNIINSLFMVSAAGVAIGVLSMGYSIPQLFLVLAALNALVAIYIYTLLPEFLMRFLAWILINILYRIKTTGRDNIPDTGPAVIVCNHVSFIDALILGGSIRRPVRFVMYYKIFQIPILSFLFRTAKAIPIASAKEDKALMDKAFDQIDAELEDGNIVCVFPEGAITNDGEVHQFRTGVERVLERRPVPVIPIGLNGLWGSWFSRMSGGGLRRIPGRLFARVNVRIGPQVAAANASAEKLELLVRTLRGDRR